MTIEVSVYSQTLQCAVQGSFENSETGLSTAIYWVKAFELTLKNHQATYFFRDTNSGINFSLGVALRKDILAKTKPNQILMSMAFNTEPVNDFYSIKGVKAETFYNKHWKWMSITNSISANKGVYTFTFICHKRWA